MQRFVITLALIGSLSACASSPMVPGDAAISMVPENAEYSVIPGGVYATITLNLRIQNRSEEPAQRFCGFGIERETGGGFVYIPGTPCTLPTSTGPRIAAYGEESMSLSLPLDTALINENAKYRVATVIAFGPDFRRGIAFKSIPFTLVRGQ
jgi:hypothetical protein